MGTGERMENETSWQITAFNKKFNAFVQFNKLITTMDPYRIVPRDESLTT